MYLITVQFIKKNLLLCKRQYNYIFIILNIVTLVHNDFFVLKNYKYRHYNALCHILIKFFKLM